MIGKRAAALCSVAIVLAFSAGLDAATYQGVAPWGAKDIPAGGPSGFDVSASGKIVVLSGLSVSLLAADGSFERTIGMVPNYSGGPEYGSFARLSPDGSQVWVGFTVNLNADDRIYSLPFAGGAATHEATLAGNYDLEFAQVGGLWKPFASAAEWAAPNSVWRLNTSGGAHTKVAELGGYGSGLAFDASGNLYAMNQTAQKLYRFAASDVQLAAQGLAGFLTPDNADFATDTAFAGSDIALDGAGNVFFNANDPSYGGASVVCLLQPGYAGAYKYDNIASGAAGYNWASQIDFGGGTGDATLKQGAVYVNDFYSGGSVTMLQVPEPATLMLALSGAAALAFLRRRR